MKKSFYERYKERVHVTGWFVIVAGLLFLSNAATGFDGRLTSVETAFARIGVIEEKLDLVIQLIQRK